MGFFLSGLKLNFSESAIHRAIGLLNVNAVALNFPKTGCRHKGTPTSSGTEGQQQQQATLKQPVGKGLYPVFAIMSHYCVCNAR